VSRVLFVILAVLGGAIAASYGFIPVLGPIPGWAINLVVGGAVGSLLAGGILLAWRMAREELAKEGVETKLVNAFLIGLMASIIGGIIALAAGFLLPIGTGARIVQGALLAGALTLGLTVGYSLDRPLFFQGGDAQEARSSLRRRSTLSSKILDTSVIIDGRIGDLLRTGFLEGEILVPEFVLAELQNIADSSNSLRRRKGRRGLEVLRKLRDDDSVLIRISNQDYPAIKEVDRKLIRFAKEQCGALITTDYNLNRVAQVEGVKVLNVNELANTVKPRFIPGEAIDVEVIDRGEEIGQGVGYLDDGTMVVVENGRRHIGRKIKATVKSTLQTEAGRMLFVEPSGESPRWGQ
jgi:uncharacterized protein YacL